MKRRWKIITGSFAVLALVLSGLWLARLTLAERLLAEVMSVWLKADHFKVSELTFDRLVISNLTAPGLSFARLEAQFSLASLLDSRLENLALEGVHYRYAKDASGTTAELSHFPAFPTLPDLPLLPPIQISNGSITLETTIGPVTVTVSGNGDGQAFSLSGNAVSNLGMLEIESQITLDGNRVTAAYLHAKGADLSWQEKALGPVEFAAETSPDLGFNASLTLGPPETAGTIRLRAPEFDAEQPIILESDLNFDEGEAVTSFVSSLLPFQLRRLSLKGTAHLQRVPWGLPIPQSPGTWQTLMVESGLTLDLESSSQMRDLASIPGAWRNNLAVAVDREQISFNTDTNEGNGLSRLTLAGTIKALSDVPRFSLAGSLESTAGSAIQSLLASYLGREMELKGTFAADGLLPVDPTEAQPDSDLLAAYRNLEPHLRFTGTFKNLAITELARVSGYTDVILSADRTLLSLDFLPDTSLSVTSITDYIEREISIPFAQSNLAMPLEPLTLSGPLSVKITPNLTGENPFEVISDLALSDAAGRQVTIRGRVQGKLGPGWRPLSLESNALEVGLSGLKGLPIPLHTITYNGAASHALGETALNGSIGLIGEDLHGALPLHVKFQNETILLRSREPGSLTSSAPITLAGKRITLEKPLNINDLKLSVKEGSIKDLTLDVQAPAVRLSGNVPATQASNLTMKLSMSEGALLSEVKIGGLQVPDQELKINGLQFAGALDLEALPRLAVGKGDARLTADAVTHPILAGPARLNVAFKPRRSDKTDVSGEVYFADRLVKLGFLGSLAGDYSHLSLSLPTTAVVFERGGLQPLAISPLLTSLREVEGTVALTGSLGWDGRNLKGKGAATITDLALRYADMPLKGLNGTLSFRDMIKIATEGDQEVTLSRFDPGLPLTDVRLIFSIEPAAETSEPTLLIKEARAQSLLGPLLLTDGAYSLASGDGRASLSFTRLDLSALAELIDVEGLQVTGILAGQVPLAFTSGTVTIANANLDDTQVGTIRYNNEATRQALSGGGESVTLMLDALEDFQYNDLQLHLDKPNDKELVFSIGLEGRNPNVLDGYPFRLNFNLTTDPTSLLAALRQGTSIGELLLKRSGRYSLSPP
ncbi:YdbH domain-containing protein [Limibacillus sp. MBR-115]|jgi:hypothetical protein|uniref:intermembrane phospholipid transport protein YdbH family protein n=1 Tax=Limibacillus sp. MBR-115 TaxID=3156465 RepID=UPI0033966652